jgi:FtsP/CotA-like multicopper oxidase with cupredoxin domain
MTSTPSRRQFLGAAAGVLTLGVATSLGESVAGALPSARIPNGGAPFTQPHELASAGGRLDVELVAAPSNVPFGDRKRFAYTYNGTTPGPTLRIRPGDVLTITLINRLGETTNLHTHGLHVSPSGHADNVFVAVADGASRTYTYEIPHDHRSGTFWYHPHMHEMVAPQVFGGLAGMIVVEDALDNLPELAGATERVLVLSDPPIGNSAKVLDASMMTKMRGREGDVVVVNGLVAPTIAAPAGTLEHWRVLNASPSRYYRLSLDGHQFTVIGTDGGRLTTPYDASEVVLAPGERVEVLITPSTAGSYRLQALPYNRGSVGMGGSAGSSARTLVATMTTTGTAPATAIPATLAPTASLALAPATSQRELVLAMGMGGGNAGGMGGGMGRSFTINGKTFDPARTNITTKLGRVEEWTLTNTSPMDHPFHLHVWPFQVVARSDGAPITPGWKDTVNVPAGESVTVRVPLTDISGRTVYHCHILDHEDLGMMGVIEVN